MAENYPLTFINEYRKKICKPLIGQFLRFGGLDRVLEK
jgi:hypothetical protein